VTGTIRQRTRQERYALRTIPKSFLISLVNNKIHDSAHNMVSVHYRYVSNNGAALAINTSQVKDRKERSWKMRTTVLPPTHLSTFVS
jgi:hypothetical protein